MKKLAIVGHFGFGYDYCDGQTVKTKNLTKVLTDRFGQEQIEMFDTHGGIKRILMILFSLLKATRKFSNVLILPAHNGLKVIAPVLALAKTFSKCALHYAVVGGWLPEYVEKYGFLRKSLLRFDGIYVETGTMKRELEAKGFENVHVVPNFKELEILEEDKLINRTELPFRLCMFSRVMREKGIEDAVKLVRQINEQNQNVQYELDIYGPVDPQQQNWFYQLSADFPQYIRYLGVVPPEKSVETLQGYDFLLFPTKFFTEGIPGTIIDAYASGVPVIASRWKSFSDVVDQGYTGWGYAFDDVEALKKLLISLPEYVDVFVDLRRNCLKKAREFLPENAVVPLLEKLV